MKLIITSFILIIIACDSGTEETTPAPPVTHDNAKYQQLITEGWTFFTSSDFDSAIVKFSEAKLLTADSSAAFIGLGWSYMLINNYSNAISELEAAKLIDNNNPDIYASLAYIQNALADYAKSLTEIDSLVSIDMNWSFDFGLSLTMTSIYTIAAQNYYLTGNMAMALQYVQLIDTLFVVNVSTDDGILALAEKIESLNPGL